MAVDIDKKELARIFFREQRAIIRTVTETRRGAHFFFRGSGPTRKTEIADIRGDGAYVVFPPAVVAGWQYRFIPGFEWTDDLQPFPEALFPRKETKITPAQTVTAGVRDIRAYIRKIPSISGQHGHDAAFRVACVLRDAGFSEVDALAEMIEWNLECAQPPWSVRELAKKVKDAFRVVLKGG